MEIEVYDPATDHRRSLLSTGAFSVPRGLAVDPTTRYPSRRKHIIGYAVVTIITI